MSGRNKNPINPKANDWDPFRKHNHLRLKEEAQLGLRIDCI